MDGHKNPLKHHNVGIIVYFTDVNLICLVYISKPMITALATFFGRGISIASLFFKYLPGSGQLQLWPIHSLRLLTRLIDSEGSLEV